MFKYNSITNHYDTEFIEKAIAKAKERNINSQLVLLEKIDGSNFGIEIDNGSIKYQSRNQYLDENAVFNNFQEVLKRNEIIPTLLEIAEEHFGKQKVIFFAEIFGGQYVNQKDGIPIQKRINYCPKNEIAFFDIALVDGEKLKYLSWFDFDKICTVFGLPSVPILKIINYGDFESSMKEALAIRPYFTTNIPDWIEKNIKCGIIKDHKFNERLSEENSAEGFIIRPYIDDFFISDCDRFIIKVKSEKFGEKNICNISQIADTINIKPYLTENRVQSAISKYPQNTNYGTIIQEIFIDAYADYETDTKTTIDADTRKILQKRYSGNVFTILKNLLKKA